MPLIDPTVSERFESPVAEGEWFTMRASNAGDTAAIAETQSKSIYPVTVRILARTIIEWSLDAEINETNVARLDPRTYQWLMGLDVQVSGRLDTEEKKDSISEPSALILPPEEAADSSIPQSWPTSPISNGSEITA